MKNVMVFDTRFKIVLRKVVPIHTFSRLPWGTMKNSKFCLNLTNVIGVNLTLLKSIIHHYRYCKSRFWPQRNHILDKKFAWK